MRFCPREPSMPVAPGTPRCIGRRRWAKTDAVNQSRFRSRHYGTAAPGGRHGRSPIDSDIDTCGDAHSTAKAVSVGGAAFTSNLHGRTLGGGYRALRAARMRRELMPARAAVSCGAGPSVALHVVCCALSVARRPLHVVCRTLSVACCPSHVVCRTCRAWMHGHSWSGRQTIRAFAQTPQHDRKRRVIKGGSRAVSQYQIVNWVRHIARKFAEVGASESGRAGPLAACD